MDDKDKKSAKVVMNLTSDSGMTSKYESRISPNQWRDIHKVVEGVMSSTQNTPKKKLSDVTKEDAKKIIKAGYPTFFRTDNWKLKDDSKELGEPCKCLYSKFKAYDFTFYDNDISITMIDDNAPLSFDTGNFDTKIECFVEAHNLGYEVIKLKNLNTIQV